MMKISLNKITKIYENGVTAVIDFNLDIKNKEFIVIVGPSGCGKSTILRIIAGLEDISKGTIKIDGKVVNDLPPKDRGIAMVLQNYALYPHLTVFENMAFSLRLEKHPKLSQDEIYKRVTDAAKILGITEYLTRKPKALSGGQRQRVAIGRAMVRESKVFLMDEPLSNLDAKLRNQMRAEIILLRKKINSTFIYVTHDQTEAMTLGDRIVIMKDGFIQQVGTPNEVFDMPDNLFVAGFIGAPMMNFIECDLIKEKDKYYVNPFGSKILVDSSKGEMLKKAKVKPQKIILGVRPEHMQLASKHTSSTFKGTVNVCEMMGSELHVHLDVKGQNVIVRIPTIAITPEQKEKLLTAGTVVDLTFTGKVMNFFNTETKVNLLTKHKNVPVNK